MVFKAEVSHRRMIERDAKNLGDYVERMRDLYYKDQNEFPA
jgi:hypothetical protein